MRIASLAVAAACVAAVAAPARAQNLMGDDVAFTVSPYFWFPSLSGRFAADGLEATANRTFAEIFDELETPISGGGRLEARWRRLGAFVDGSYVDVGAEDVALAPARGDLEVEGGFVDFGLMFRVAEWPWSTPASGAAEPVLGTRLDLYAGGRYSTFEIEIDPDVGAGASRSRDWIDPIVGLQLSSDLTNAMGLMIRGDVGGFEVNSQFSWSATAALTWRVRLGTGSFGLMAGYKALDQDFDKNFNEYRFDAILHGPMVGLTLKF